MTDQETKVLEIVKSRLGITDGSHDTLVTSYVMEMEFRIKHYCQRNDIPDALIHTWASMVIDALKEVAPGIIPADVVGIVTGVRIGDTSIGGAGSGDGTANKTNIEQIVLNYAADLHRWRRLRW